MMLPLPLLACACPRGGMHTHTPPHCSLLLPSFFPRAAAREPSDASGPCRRTKTCASVCQGCGWVVFGLIGSWLGPNRSIESEVASGGGRLGVWIAAVRRDSIIIAPPRAEPSTAVQPSKPPTGGSRSKQPAKRPIATRHPWIQHLRWPMSDCV